MLHDIRKTNRPPCLFEFYDAYGEVSSRVGMGPLRLRCFEVLYKEGEWADRSRRTSYWTHNWVASLGKLVNVKQLEELRWSSNFEEIYLPGISSRAFPELEVLEMGGYGPDFHNWIKMRHLDDPCFVRQVLIDYLDFTLSWWNPTMADLVEGLDECFLKAIKIHLGTKPVRAMSLDAFFDRLVSTAGSSVKVLHLQIPNHMEPEGWQMHLVRAVAGLVRLRQLYIEHVPEHAPKQFGEWVPQHGIPLSHVKMLAKAQEGLRYVFADEKDYRIARHAYGEAEDLHLLDLEVP